MNAYKIINVRKSSRAKINNTPKKQRIKDISSVFGSNSNADTYNADSLFSDSLASMTQNDIILNETAKDVKKESVDYLRYFILLVCLAVFVWTGYQLSQKIYSYISAAREYDALRDIFNAEEEHPQTLKKTKTNRPIKDILFIQTYAGQRAVESEIQAEIGEVDKKRAVNMQLLSDKNPDFFGWINVSFTTINYPVVQTENNSYYLNHSFENKWSPSGAIFCDFRNKRDIIKNRNTVIYGHNMLDGAMFQPLIDYGRYETYFKYGIIELISENGTTYYYEVFSVRDEDPRFGYIQTYFEDDEEYVEFLNTMQERSYFQKNIELNEESKIITLSTCVNETWRDWRFVVQGVLVDVK